MPSVCVRQAVDATEAKPLMSVSVFDSQVFVFVSLLYWALQSVTGLLPTKKKIN